MSRTADYTIEGFIYQFVISLEKLLDSADNATITIEGPIEDIDIVSPTGTKVIQCKYHSSKNNFTLSAIYKPVLQMLEHYSNNSKASIQYRLHAHFPNETVGSIKKLTEADIDQILKSKDTNLKSYITKLKGFTDKKGFLGAFEIEFGASYENAKKAVETKLVNEGFSKADVSELFYPNAIHQIGELSIKHKVSERKVKKSDFVKELKNRKATAISRWTQELKKREDLLKLKRKQLAKDLGANSKVRALLIDSDYVNQFKTQIPNFIIDFIEKYNSLEKLQLQNTPTIVIFGSYDINDIWTRINNKGVSVLRGEIARVFKVDEFIKEPIKIPKKRSVDFRLRLCNLSEFQLAFENLGIDNIYILSDKKLDAIEKLKDVYIDKIESANLNEIKYLLSLTNTL